MLDIILYQPQIPPNTGNIIRLCANAGARLSLIGPLGFDLELKSLRRAGLDYHDLAACRQFDDWAHFMAEAPPKRLFAITKFGSTNYSDARFQTGDALLFGSETAGLPPEIRDNLPDGMRLFLPMRPDNRSLNLSNAVAIVLYEAWRQLDFEGHVGFSD